MLVRTALTDINVNVYFPPILPLEEPVIREGTGSLLTFIDLPIGGPPSIRYTLQVDKGTQVNKPRVGEVVVASGKDSDGRLVALPGKLETVSLGPPVIFQGPYE
jgi:hypothetical protein